MVEISPTAICIIITSILLAVLKLVTYLTCGKFIGKTRMDGKTVIVTGATGGLGKETATDLARRGARVVLACRNITTANAIKDEIIELTGNKNVVVKKLDLSSLKSVREFAKDFLETEKELHVLIHNAGTVEVIKQVRSDDGIEYTMATNYYGPFLLTHLLIDVLKRSAPSRIVIVSSFLYNLASVNLKNLNPVNSFPPYIYCVSKLASIYFCQELARRLEGTNVTANCLHPGVIDTGIWRNVPFPLNLVFKAMSMGLFKTIEEGTQTSIYVAVSEDLKDISGKYFRDCCEMDVPAFAKSEKKAKILWEKSEEIVKLTKSDPQI